MQDAAMIVDFETTGGELNIVNVPTGIVIQSSIVRIKLKSQPNFPTVSQ